MPEIIRPCLSDDIPRLMEIFKTVYPANPLLQKKEYFDWQFRQSPFYNPDSYLLWILEDCSGIRGFLGYNPLEFRYGDTIQRGCWTSLWYAEKKDGSGLRLLSRLMADFDHRFFIGLSRDSQAVYSMYRIPLLKEMPRFVGVLDAEAAAELFVIHSGSAMNVFAESAASLSRLGISVSDGSVMVCRRFDDGEEFFFDAWQDVRGYVRRTGAYLNWRYADIPFHDYSMIRDGKGGFGVYRAETVMGTEHRVMRILEWNFKGNAAEDAMALLIREGINSGVVLMDFFCTALFIGDELTRLGFFNENAITPKIPYLFRPLFRTDGISLAIDLPPHRKNRTVNFGEWYITKGDADIDRMKL